MAQFSWVRWLRSLCQPTQKTFRKPRRSLILEQLETRLTPTTYQWTGASTPVDPHFSNPNNWIDTSTGQPGAPTGANDDLVFQAGPTQLNPVNDLNNAVFNSITISGGGYTLSGNAITLGDPTVAGSGSLIVNGAAATNEIINFNMQLAGPLGSRQYFTVQPGASVTINGQLSGPSGAELTKEGTGMLTLTNDNSAFLGSFTIDTNSGVVQITNANALGFVSNTGNPAIDELHATTVDRSSQLQLNNVTGTITTHLLLNGAGVSTGGVTGALLDISGNTTWAGPIELDSNSTIGVAAAGGETVSSVTVFTGGVGYTSTPTVTFTGGGATTQATGTAVVSNGVVTAVNIISPGSGYISPPTVTFTGGGATTQATANANLAPTTLTINGQITDLGAGYSLTKEGPGTLLLEPLGVLAGNTYRGQTIINGGMLEMAHPFALGPGGSANSVVVNATSIESGTLALDFTDNPLVLIPAQYLNYDAQGNPIGFIVPSVQLTLNGFGEAGLSVAPRQMATRTTGPAPITEITGTLNNQAGDNSWEPNITFWSSASNVLNNSTYYEAAICIGAVANTTLTIDGVLQDNGVGAIAGDNYSFSKVGLGRVTLTSANVYVADIDILQGYLRIEDSNALGQSAGLGKEAWWGTSLELATDSKPDSVPLANKKPGQNAFDLYLPTLNYIWADGPGANHDGALINVSGDNYIEGGLSLQSSNNGTTINVFPDPDPNNLNNQPWNDLSQLTVDSVVDSPFNASLTKIGQGELVLNDANTYGGGFGTETFINQGWITVHNNLALGTAGGTVQVASGAALVLKTDLNGGNLTLPYNFNLSGTGMTPYRFAWLDDMGAIENLGGDNVITGSILLNGIVGLGAELDGALLPNPPVSALTIKGAISEAGGLSGPGGINKLGSQRLTLQGAGTYTGPVDIQDGVLRIQNGTALGAGTSTTSITTVETGTALELASATPQFSASEQTGLTITGEHLILNGTGNANFGDTPLMNLSDANTWAGLVSLNNSMPFDVPVNTQLTLSGVVDDAANTAVNGSDLIKLGSGELDLSAANTYRGVTYVTQGILGISNDQALGLTINGTVVSSPGQLQLQGDLTIAGEPLVIQGPGSVPQSAVQTITLSGTTTGTFTLAFNGSLPSSALSYGATAPQVHAALDALSTIGGSVGGSVTVYQIDVATYEVVFQGSFLGQNLAGLPLVATGTGGLTPTVVTTAAGAPDNGSPNSGALRAISGGSSVWTGPVALAGPSTIGVDGGNASGTIPAAELTLIGVLSDQTLGANNYLTKTGTGTLVLSGANTYGGTTEVSQGVVVVHNPSSLGATTNGTLVDTGAALDLESNLLGENLTLNGYGLQFNGHNTGALENVSGNNNYTGTITLASDSEIGVDSGSSLTTQAATPTGLGIVGPGFNLTKELTGTLTLLSADNYGGNAFIVPNELSPNNTFAGGTLVAQGILNIENSDALGTTGHTTTVVSGAQLQLQSPAGNPGLVVPASETLRISGTGETDSGALDNVGGQNLWTGSVVLAQDPGFPTGTLVSSSGGGGGGGGPGGNLVVTDTSAGATPSLLANTILAGTGLTPTNITYVGTNVQAGTFTGGNGVVGFNNGIVMSSGSVDDVVGPNIDNDSNGAFGEAGDPQLDALIAPFDGGAVTDDAATLSFDIVPTSNTFSLNYVFTSEEYNVFSTPGSAFCDVCGIFVNGVDYALVPGTADPVCIDTVNLSTNTAYYINNAIPPDPFPAPGPILNINQNGLTTVLTVTAPVTPGVINHITIAVANGTDNVNDSNVFIEGATPTPPPPPPPGPLPPLPPSPPIVAIGVTPTSSTDNLTITGQISEAPTPPTTDIALDKVGTGLLILNPNGGNNIYSGGTTVSNGDLRIQQNGALGTGTGTLVDTGASLQLDNSALSPAGTPLNVSTQALTLNGTGFNNTGALENFNGNNTWAGSVTLQSSSTISVDPGSQLTVSGVVQDSTRVLVPAPSLTKDGTGTLFFPAATANTYNGLTDIDAGVLNIQNPNSLGNSDPEIQTVTVNSTGTAGTFTLAFNGQTTGALAYNVPASGGVGLTASMENALDGLSSIGGVGGFVTVTANGFIYTVTFGGTLGDTDLPQMTAIGINGATPVVSTSQNGPEGTIVNSNATLQVQGDITVAEALTLNGSGYNNQGALENVSGSSDTWAAPVSLGSNASVSVDGAADILTMNQPISDGGLGFGLSTSGPGTLDDAGTTANTYTGLTQVNQGTLLLDKSATSAVEIVTILGSAGTFTLTFNGQTTNPALAFDAPATGAGSVQTALNSLSSIGGVGGFVTVTASGNSDNIYTITFGGSLANANQPQITAAGAGGTTPIVGTLTDGTTVPAAFGGNLTIGAGLAGNSAVAKWIASNEAPVTATVTVQSDGTLNLNGQTNTINALVMNDGQATTGTNGTLTVSSVNMTGGTFLLATAGSRLILAGTAPGTADITATSDGPATITGPGKLMLNGVTRNFTVNRGTGSSDLIVSSVIAGSGSEGLTKNGNGILELDAVNTYTGVTTINAGDVQVGGTIDNVLLNGGTLSGTGNVNTVNPASSSATGTIYPGNGGTNTPGILTSKTVTLTNLSSFFVVLNDSHSPPIPGTDYSQLDVSGDIYLNNATLTGLVGVAAQNGDQFTIIQTTGGTVHGTFASGNIVYISGEKFTVDYSNPNQVVLTRVLANATVTVTSSVGSSNTSVYGQAVIFTAQVTPEAGGPAIPTTDMVTFTLDGINYFPVNVNSSGQAIFNPLTATGSPLAITSPGSPHTLVAAFSGDSTYFNPATGSLSPGQTVNPANTTIQVASSVPNPVAGQTVTLTATIVPTAPATGIPGNGFATAIFTIDNVPQSPPVIVVGGQAQLTTTFTTSPSPHHISVSWTGDGNFNPGSTTSDYLLSVQPDAVNIAVNATPSAAFYGQQLLFTTTVSAASPGTGTPTGTVNFSAGNTALPPSQTLSNGSAAVQTSTLAAGTYSINVAYLGDSNFIHNTNSLAGFVVSPDATQTVLSSTVNPSAVGQSVTFTATISNTQSGSSASPAGGSVTFTTDGGNSFVAALVGGHASFTETFPTATTHSIEAVYSGSNNFSGSTASPLIQQVGQAATVTTVTSTSNPLYIGQAVTFFAVVTNQTVGGPTPTSGTVTFTVDGSQTLVNLSGTNQATLTTSFATAGPHSVTAQYDGIPTFAASAPSTADTQTVLAANTTTTVNASPNPGFFGQSVALTALVSVANPALGTVNAGTVTFVVDNVNETPVNVVNGTASLALSGLSAGPNSITASYSGDNANFNPSTTTTTVTENVGQAQTSATVASGVNPSAIGQPVTFTVNVANQNPGGPVPTNGTVTLVVDSVDQLNPVTLTNGVATFSYTFSTLGQHHVSAIYNGSGNFAASVPAPVVLQSVNRAGSIATVTASADPSVVGQPVTFTATVTNQASGGTTPTTGAVTFTVDGNTQPQVTLVNSNQATFTTTFTTVSSHTITATYGGNTTFAASSPSAPFAQTVNKDNTSVTILSGLNPSVYGEAITFLATVSAASPGAGTPVGGSVTFAVDGANQSAVNVNGNDQASITLSGLSAGPHNITATYSGDGVNFTGNPPAPAFVQNVSEAPTSTAVSAATNPTVVGAAVNFTATVSSSAAGVGTPTGGTVTFVVDGTPQTTTVPLSNGIATAAIQFATVGPHTVAAIYNGGNGSNFAASTQSPPVTENVNLGSTMTAVSSSVNPSGIGQSVTFTATVSNQIAGGDTPTTGPVTFVVDGFTEPVVNLNGSNQATFTTSFTTTMPHTVTATYGGNSNFQGSLISPTFTQNVSHGATTITISSALNPSVYGQSVTLTATVQAGTAGIGNPTSGTLTFVVDGASQTPVSLSGSSASITLSGLSTGPHAINANYSGDNGLFNASTTATPFTQTVAQANTNTTVTAAVNPAALGQPVTFTAKVLSTAAGAGTPTGGTVTFTVDNVPQPNPATLSNGQATFSAAFSTLGTHTVTATFNGSTNFAASAASPPLSESVSKIATNTVISASSNPSGLGQAVAFTATVSPQTTGGGTPTGSVTFFLDSTQQTTVTLSNGQASFTANNLTLGAHSVSATYSPTANYLGSSSTTFNQNVVNSTTTTVSSGLNPSVFGQSVTYTATVTSPAGTPSSGTVTFLVDGVAQGSPASLSNGHASIVLSNLSTGPHNITATYSGDNGNFGGSTSATPVTQTVNKDAASTTLAENMSTSVFGQAATFYATSWAFAPGNGMPSGTETIFIDGVSQGPVNMVSGTNSAVFTINTLSPGNHTIYAQYNGDGNFNGSKSTQLTLTVNPDAASNTLSENVTASVYGQTVYFFGAAWAFKPGSGTPTGTMLYYLDGNANPIATVATANGTNYATLPLSNLSAGPHTLQTRYLGDGNFTGNVSAPLNFMVYLTSSVTAVGVSASTVPSGQPLTLFGAAWASPPGGGTPTGTVSFFVDGAYVGTQTIINGTNYGALSLSNLSIGTHTISATYSGDGNFAGSSSTNAVTVTVLDSSGATQLFATTSTSDDIVSVGTPFSVFVQAFDASGNAVTAFTNRPTAIAVISAPAGGTVSGTLGDSFVSTFNNGGAEFDGLEVTEAGTYTLRIYTAALYYDLTITTFGRQT